MSEKNPEFDRRGFLTVAIGTSTVLLAGCGGGGAPTASPTPTESPFETTRDVDDRFGFGGGAEEVTIRDNAYDPMEVSIDAGEEVEWTNDGDVPHTVTSDTFTDDATDWNFDEEVASGESVSHTFDDSGVYQYYCTIHGESTMCGVVLVGDVSFDGSLPCE